MDQAALLSRLRSIAGRGHVLTDDKQTLPYRTGFRYGSGAALAVVRPGSLVEHWRVLNVCVAANVIVIFQAANTGLTGGSTPDGDDYDRPVVIISTSRLKGIHLIDDGRQVICLPGATLHELERRLRPIGREPHSVIGSSCIGASVLGGICNNSGGSLIRRGPAYTEAALFARLDANGSLELVNHLGFDLGSTPEEILSRIERGELAAQAAANADTAGNADAVPARCSNDDYAQRVREIDASTPARFNADPRGLFETAGCAGKLAVFAVRLDTFPKDEESRVFYVGTRDPAELTALRRHMLSQFASLPVAAEYMQRDCFDVAECYGKDMFYMIRWLGTERLPRFFALKRRFDSVVSARGLRWLSSDRVLQALSRCLPAHLPDRMKVFRARYEHHLTLKMSGSGIAEARNEFGRRFPSAAGDFFECTAEEGEKAFLHRFVAAGAAIRYAQVHAREVQDILALDVALARSDPDWNEVLPMDLQQKLHRSLYYGHFFCHVFHRDYIVRKGCDVQALKEQLLKRLDAQGAEYPAEHNVGHLYRAKPALVQFYQALDPCNAFNPGIGQTSRRADWRSEFDGERKLHMPRLE